MRAVGIRRGGQRFRTAVPRGVFKTKPKGKVVTPKAVTPKKVAPKETSLLKSPVASPLTAKVGASPLTKSVSVNVSVPRGGASYQTSVPRDSGGNVIRGKNDMIKTAAMIGIPAVIGVGALFVMLRKK